MDSDQNSAPPNGSPVQFPDYSDKIRRLEKMHSNLTLLLEFAQKETKEVSEKYEHMKGNIERVGTMLEEMKNAVGELEAPRKHKLSPTPNTSPAKKQKQSHDAAESVPGSSLKYEETERPGTSDRDQEGGQNDETSRTDEGTSEQKPLKYQLTSSAELEKIKRDGKTDNPIVGRVEEYDAGTIKEFKNREAPFSFILNNESNKRIQCKIWKEKISDVSKIKKNRIISVTKGKINNRDTYPDKGNVGFTVNINKNSFIEVLESKKTRSKTD